MWHFVVAKGTFPMCTRYWKKSSRARTKCAFNWEERRKLISNTALNFCAYMPNLKLLYSVLILLVWKFSLCWIMWESLEAPLSASFAKSLWIKLNGGDACVKRRGLMKTYLISLSGSNAAKILGTSSSNYFGFYLFKTYFESLGKWNYTGLSWTFSTALILYTKRCCSSTKGRLDIYQMSW